MAQCRVPETRTNSSSTAPNVGPSSRPSSADNPPPGNCRLQPSTEVGRRLLSDASETVLLTSVELGGNAPFVVFQDAYIDAAVARAKLRCRTARPQAYEGAARGNFGQV